MKDLYFMPKYELMYLLGSHVSDDQVPTFTEMVNKFLAENKAENVEETQLGKKKLAYPIKKTRNGFYVVVTFDMDGKNVNAFEARIRTQNANIIRHMIVNLDEHLTRLAKDQVLQAKLPKRDENGDPAVAPAKAADTYTTKTMEKTRLDVKPAPAPVVEPTPTEPVEATSETTTEETATEKPKRGRKPKAKSDILDLSTEDLDKKIEAALTDDLLK